jgi:squalene cyclase
VCYGGALVVQSCVTRNWSENTESQVVNTAWCVLTLLAAEWDLKPIRRAVRFLIDCQLPNGDWQLQDVSGVFNANCSISYK